MSVSRLGQGVTVLTGATSGIGREMALQLASAGSRLVLAARRRERLEEVAAACRERGATVTVVVTDVGVEADCERLVRSATDEHGRIDTLILDAGVSQAARLDQLRTPEPLERLMRVNYLGAAWCTFHALPWLRESGGRIIAVASLAALTGAPTRTGYAASKHAMAGFFDSLRIELEGSGVSVTVAYPGFVASEIRERALGADGSPQGISDIDVERAMPAATCARLILQAGEARRRQVVMTLRGRLGRWLKLVAPGLVDRIARRTIRRGR